MKDMYGSLEILVEKLLELQLERAAALFADAGFSVVAFDVQRGIVARAEETVGIQ